MSTYSYDHANRLVSVVQGADLYEFRYNGLGERLRQTVNGEPTTYTLDLNAGLTQVLADRTNGYLYGVGRIGEEQPAGWQLHLADALGSVRQLGDASAAVTLAQAYEPFGSVLSGGGSTSTAFQFTGEQVDESGLVFLRARYYAPGRGRFLTRDVWNGDPSRPMSYNVWLYVYGNPANLSDPRGIHIEYDHIGNGNPFTRFDTALRFIYEEMIRNSHSGDAELMRRFLQDSGLICADPAITAGSRAGGTFAAYALFALKVSPGAEWDHKAELRRLLNIRRGVWLDEYFPIRGDQQFEYFYDIWSNIHYGYVGASIGFDRDILRVAPNLEKYVPQDWEALRALARKLVGQYDPGDDISIDIGFTLWDRYRFGLSIAGIHQELIARRDEYFAMQDLNGSGKLEEREIRPDMGKLLPRTHAESDWR